MYKGLSEPYCQHCLQSGKMAVICKAKVFHRTVSFKYSGNYGLSFQMSRAAYPYGTMISRKVKITKKEVEVQLMGKSTVEPIGLMT